MNRTHTSQIDPLLHRNAAAWSLDQRDVLPPRPRLRRIRRQIIEYRSDVLLSGLLFVLLIWMGFVALTLWH